MAQKKKLTEQIASKVYQEAVKKFVTADRATQNRTQQQLSSSGRNLMQQAAARKGQSGANPVSNAVNNLRTGGQVYERPSFDRTYADTLQKLLRSNPEAAKQLAQGPTVPDTFKNLHKATGLYSAQGGAQVSPTYQELVKKYFDAAPTTETQKRIQAMGGYGALTPEQLAAMGSKENYRPEDNLYGLMFLPNVQKATRKAYINQQEDLQAAQAYGANDTAQNLLTNIGIVSDDYLSYMQKQLPGMWEDEQRRYEEALAAYPQLYADFNASVGDYINKSRGDLETRDKLYAIYKEKDPAKKGEALKKLTAGDVEKLIELDNIVSNKSRSIADLQKYEGEQAYNEIDRLVKQYGEIALDSRARDYAPKQPTQYPYNKLLERVNTEAAARETMLPYFNAIAEDPEFIEKSAFVPRYPQGEGDGAYSKPDIDVNVALRYYVDDGTGRLTENQGFFLEEPDRDRIEYLIVNGEVPIDGSKMYVSPLIANEYFGSGYDMMTDVERSIYNYYYNTGDIENARAYLKAMSPTLRSREKDIRNMTWEEFATDNWFTGTLAFLGKGVTGTAAALSYPLELGLNALGVENVDNPFVDYRNVVGQAQLAELEDADWLGLELAGQNIPQMAYNVASSMQDMFTARGAANALGTPNAALSLMGMQAGAHDFTDTAGTDMSLLERTIHSGGVAGLEALTEKLPFDAVNARPGSLGYLARSFGSEFGEEAFNQAAGYALDDLTAMAFGRETPTQEELTQMELLGVENPGAEMFKQRAEETLGAGVVGGLAGLGMGATHTIADAAQTVPTGSQINQAGNGSQLVELGTKMKEGSESRKMAEQLIERQGKGKKLSSMQLGQLYRTLTEETHQEYQDVIRDLTKNEVTEAIAQKYHDLGLEPETTFKMEELAEGIIAMADGKKISGRLQKFIETHRVTKEIAREFTEEENPEFWVQQLGSKRLGEMVKHMGRVAEIDSTKAKQTTATPQQKQNSAIQQETEAETRRLVGSSTAAADSREVAFSDGSGERTGEIVRVERTSGGLQVVVNDGGTERTVAYDAINRVGGSGVARILAYAKQHIEAEAPEINLMLGQLKNGGEASEIISAVEEGVKAGYFGMPYGPAQVLTPQVVEATGPVAAKSLTGQAVQGQQAAQPGIDQFVAELQQREAEVSRVINERWVSRMSDEISKMDSGNPAKQAFERSMKELSRTATSLLAEARRAGGMSRQQAELLVNATNKLTQSTFTKTDATPAMREIMDNIITDVNNAINKYMDMAEKAGQGQQIAESMEEMVTPQVVEATGQAAKQTIETMNSAGAQEVLQSARRKAGEKVSQAVQKAEETKTTMDDAARQQIVQAGYSLGQQMAQDAESQRIQNVGRGAAGRGAVSYMGTVANEANVTDTGVRQAVKGIKKRMTAQQNAAISAIEQIAAATGIDFVFYESQAAQGEEVAAPNGFFDTAANAIFLDLNSGRNAGGEALAETAVIKTAAHELTHYIERNSGKEYAEFREAAKQELAARGQDYAQLVMNKVQERGLNRTQAQAEVLADAAEMMLKDSEAIQRLAKNKPGLLSTVKKFLQDFARRIRRAFEGLTGTSAEAQALTQVVNGVERYVGNLQQLWDDALVSAAENVTGRATKEAGEKAGERLNSFAGRSAKTMASFNRWFRNSEVTNEDGSPKVVYHATNKEFNQFDINKLGAVTDKNAADGYSAATAHIGFWFSDHRVDTQMRTKRVIPAYLSIQNMYDAGTLDGLISEIWDTYSNDGYEYDTEDPSTESAIEAGNNFRNTIIQYGYDGIQVKDREFGGMSYIVFNPEQIKSATDNIGTYDTKNPDIRYSSRRSAMSIRQALNAMAITPDMTETEKSLLQIYQKYATELTSVQEQMTEQEAILQGDTATEDEKRQAQNRLKTLRGMARRAEAKMRQAERSDGFATLMNTSREMVRRFMVSEGFEQTAAAVEDQLTELKRELQNVRNDLSGYSQEQQTQMLRKLFDPAALTRAAKNLKTSYQSRMTQKEISNRLAIMYANLYATDADASVRFNDQLHEMARDLLGSVKGGTSETLEMLKEHIGSIRLTEEQVQELKSQGISMSTFRRVVNPVVRITSSKNADTLMSYITEGDLVTPNPIEALFTGHTSEGDAIVRLYELIKAESEGWNETAKEDKEALLSTMVDITEQAGLPAPEGAKASDIILGAMLKSADVSDKMQKRLRELDAKLATARKSVNTMKVKAAQQEGLPQEIARYYGKLEQERSLMEVQEETERIKTQLKTENRGKMQEFFTTRELMEKNASLKRQIKRTVTMLDRRIRKETDSNRVPEGFKPVVEDMIRLFIRTNDVMHIFAGNEIAYAAKVYEKLAALDGTDIHQLDDMYKEDIEATLNGMRTAIEAFAADMPKMTQAEKLSAKNQCLEDINDLVQEIRKITIDIDQTLIGGQRASIAQTAGAMVDELEKKENYSTREGKAGDIAEKLKDAARNGNLTPVYFFRLLGNETLSRLNRDIESAENRYGLLEKEAKETVRSIQDKHNYYAWKDDEALTFTTVQGMATNQAAHTITLTKDEALALWATWKREHTDGLYTSSHLENGGFNLKSGKRVVDKRVERDTGGHKLTQADMNTIADYLTDEQKAYADEMVQYLSTDMAELGNETSMELFGIRKFKESYYFPMSVNRGQLAQKSSAGATFPDANRIAHTSMTKRRVDQATKPLVIGSFTDVATDHINQMLLYNTFALPIENMNRVLNQVTEDETGSELSMRQMIEKKYGKDLYDYLVRYIADLNGGPQRDSTEKGWDKLLGLYKKGAVAASMSVAVQQPMSVIRAMMEVSPKYFVPLMNHADNVNWSREHEQLLQYSGVAVLKDIGGFDMTNVGGANRAIAGNIEDTYDTYKTWKKIAERWRLRLGVGDAKGAERWKAMGRTWNDLFGFFASKADELTWTYMWRAIKAETEDRNPGMDTGSEAFLQLAANRFNEVMRLTQVYDSTLVRSQNMRSKTAFMKMFTAFMAEQTLTANMLMDAAASKKPKKIARAAGVFLISQMLTAAAAAVVKAGRDDDDDKTWAEKWLASMGSSLGGWGSNLNPIALLPGFRDLMSLLDGYDIERSDMSVITDVLEEINKLSSGKYDDNPWRAVEGAGGAVANLLGVPMKNVMRDLRTMYNTVYSNAQRPSNTLVMEKDALNNFRLRYIWEPKTGFDVYYGRLYEAYRDGDTQEQESLKEYLTINGKDEGDVSKGVKAAAKKAFLAGKLEEAEAQKVLKAAEIGQTDDERHWTLQEWIHERDGEEGEYRKYDDFFAAVESGKDLPKVIKEYTDHGVKAQTLASQITSQYKDEFIQLSKTNRTAAANLQARLLNAYVALGYDRQKKLKDIQAWLK